MTLLTATSLSVLLLVGCTQSESETTSAPAVATPPASNAPSSTTQAPEQISSQPSVAATSPSPESTVNENAEQGTWSGQIAVGQPISMFNYVGAESGDFAPMRFRNDSEVGKKILAACSNGEMCEFTGVVEWLDEAPPPDASAVGQIVRVDSARRGATR
jgi:hypothetical protein